MVYISGEGNGNPLQYSCLENPVDRGAWQATVHGVARIGHDLVTKPPPMVYTRLLRRHSGKESSCQCKRGKRCRFYPWVGKIPWSRCLAESFHFCLRFNPWVRKIPWRMKWQPTPVFLLGEFHKQRSLTGYSPWGCKELDTTEWLSTKLNRMWPFRVVRKKVKK